MKTSSNFFLPTYPELVLVSGSIECVIYNYNNNILYSSVYNNDKTQTFIYGIKTN